MQVSQMPKYLLHAKAAILGTVLHKIKSFTGYFCLLNGGVELLPQLTNVKISMINTYGLD